MFLLGSFLIVTWKSYSIFSQKYVKATQQMQLDELEKQGQYISQQFSDLQKILANPGDVEAQLKARGIGLLAKLRAMALQAEVKRLAVWGSLKRGRVRLAGYTRAAPGNIGVCVGTSGPAGTDMITGLYSASADSIPILCITGQAPVAKLHKEDFQAINIADIAAPVTKWAVTVME